MIFLNSTKSSLIHCLSSAYVVSIRFPSSIMLLGRKVPQLAESGDFQRMLAILDKGDFFPEKYNEAYQSFVQENHRKEGLIILEAAHQKFPKDRVGKYNAAGVFCGTQNAERTTPNDGQWFILKAYAFFHHGTGLMRYESIVMKFVL